MDEELGHERVAYNEPRGFCVRIVDFRAPVGALLLGCLLLLLAVAVALSQAVLDDVFFDEKKAYNVQTWLSWLLSFVPLFFAVLFLGVPPLRKMFLRWQNAGRIWRSLLLPGLVPMCWLFSALPLLQYDPLAHVYVAVITFAAIGAVQKGRTVKSNWIDLFVGVVLFAMLDLRWIGQHFYIGENSYNFFAVAFSLIVIVGWHSFEGFE